MRSLLFGPGNSAKMMAKAASSGADVLIFDLEDAVHPDAKPTYATSPFCTRNVRLEDAS